MDHHSLNYIWHHSGIGITRHPFKVESLGSIPSGVTIVRTLEVNNDNKLCLYFDGIKRVGESQPITRAEVRSGMTKQVFLKLVGMDFHSLNYHRQLQLICGQSLTRINKSESKTESLCRKIGLKRPWQVRQSVDSDGVVFKVLYDD